MNINIDLEGFGPLDWEDLWPRRVKFGICEAWCGLDLIIAATKPFSPDENELFHWITEQDGCELYGIMAMADGRELMVFTRTFKKQTKEAAVNEYRTHMQKVLDSSGLRRLFFAGNVT